MDTQSTSLPSHANSFSCQPAPKVNLKDELKAAISPSLNKHDRQVILDTLLGLVLTASLSAFKCARLREFNLNSNEYMQRV